MTINWDEPTNASLYTEVLAAINGKIAHNATRIYDTDDNIPVNTIRYANTARQEERWDGDDWGGLFPWAAWTPTFGAIAGGATYTSVTIDVARYRYHGTTFSFNLLAHGSTNGTATTALTFTLPASITAVDTDVVLFGGGSTAPAVLGQAYFTSTTTMAVRKDDNSNFPTSVSGVYIFASGTFEMVLLSD